MGATRRLLVLFLLATAMASFLPSPASGIPRETSGWSTEEELGLSWEWSRRILAAANYISYDALRRDSVPCSRRGASYYNCRPGASANPYTRGCSAITRCRT